MHRQFFKNKLTKPRTMYKHIVMIEIILFILHVENGIFKRFHNVDLKIV